MLSLSTEITVKLPLMKALKFLFSREATVHSDEISRVILFALYYKIWKKNNWKTTWKTKHAFLMNIIVLVISGAEQREFPWWKRGSWIITDDKDYDQKQLTESEHKTALTIQ